MQVYNGLKKLINTFRQRKREMAPDEAYNLWASAYDSQTGNPLVYLDNIVFAELLNNVDLEGKLVVDIGCGTGTHWKKFESKKIAAITGFEVSRGMLDKLHQKYPGAQTHLLHGNSLAPLADASCDVIISTLVIGYIENLQEAFTEWNRILKPNGEIIITDFHPAALQRGDTRSFNNNGSQVLIKNYIHPLPAIKALANNLGWEDITIIERNVDETIKHFYYTANAMQAYQQTFNKPILYGWRFKKRS